MHTGGLVAKSCPTLLTPWTVAHQAPLSMGFSRQEYWSELPFASPGAFPDPGIKPRSPALQADSLPTVLQGKPLSMYTTSFLIARNFLIPSILTSISVFFVCLFFLTKAA